MKHQDALAQLARETARARKSLALERAIRAGFWFALAICTWAALALGGLHEKLPLMWQSLAALGALGVFAWLGIRTQRAWNAPTEADARARLATDSHLEAGTFDTLRDQPTRYDAVAVALWSRERENAIERATRARAKPTRIRLDDIDRFRLRYLVAAAFLTVAVLAGDNVWDRVQCSVTRPCPLRHG